MSKSIKNTTNNNRATKDSIIMIIWRILYPLLIYYVVEFLVEMVMSLELGTGLIAEGMVSGSVEFQAALVQRIRQNAPLIMTIRCGFLIPIFLMFMKMDIFKHFGHGLYKSFEPMGRKWLWLCAVPVIGIGAGFALNHLFAITGFNQISAAYQSVSSVIYAQPVWMIILSSTLAAPLAEEFLFRGLLYKRLRKYLSPVPAALISSLLFALVHGNIVQGLYAFLMGMVFCFLYENYKSIWVSVLAHAAVNLAASMMTTFYPGFGADFSIGIWIAIIAMEFLLSSGMFYLVKKKFVRDIYRA